jgi:hypothetical protein
LAFNIATQLTDINRQFLRGLNSKKIAGDDYSSLSKIVK